jgi:4-amino-4-deoxy-L-arabinose transferase-like glycosyltransferase
LWVLSLLLLDDLREHDEPWRPVLLGLTIGAAFLAKYTALLLVPVTLIFLGTSVQTRRWLRRPSLYASGLLALAVASPVMVWNYQHHWPTVTLHLVERMSAPSGQTLGRHALHMVVDQFVLYQPLVFPGLLAILGAAVARAHADARYRLLAAASAPVLLFWFFRQTCGRKFPVSGAVGGPIAVSPSLLLKRRTRYCDGSPPIPCFSSGDTG